jgi:hypothetical protein
VIIRGDHTRRDYWYAPAPVAAAARGPRPHRRAHRPDRRNGKRPRGRVHLHVEIRVRGLPVDPKRELHAWDRWS